MSNDELCSSGFIARLKANDNQAFVELVEFMGPRLGRALETELGLRPEDAEEVAYDSLLKIRQKISKFYVQGAAKFTTWARRVAINTGIDFIRKQNTEFESQAKVIAAGAAEDGEISEYDRQSHQDWKRSGADGDAGVSAKTVRRLDAMTKILDGFSESDQNLLRLRTCGGLTYEQIAEIEDEPVGRLRTRHKRAFDRLKEELLKTEI